MLKLNEIRFTTPVNTSARVAQFFEDQGIGAPRLLVATYELQWSLQFADYVTAQTLAEVLEALEDDLRNRPQKPAACGWASVGTDTD